jgi:hypothetical protein
LIAPAAEAAPAPVPAEPPAAEAAPAPAPAVEAAPTAELVAPAAEPAPAAALGGSKRLTAMQNETFTMCGRSYRVTIVAQLHGTGVALSPASRNARSVEFSVGETKRLSATCEATLVRIGDAPARIVTMAYREAANLPSAKE